MEPITPVPIGELGIECEELSDDWEMEESLKDGDEAKEISNDNIEPEKLIKIKSRLENTIAELQCLNRDTTLENTTIAAEKVEALLFDKLLSKKLDDIFPNAILEDKFWKVGEIYIVAEDHYFEFHKIIEIIKNQIQCIQKEIGENQKEYNSSISNSIKMGNQQRTLYMQLHRFTTFVEKTFEQLEKNFRKKNNSFAKTQQANKIGQTTVVNRQPVSYSNKQQVLLSNEGTKIFQNIHNNLSRIDYSIFHENIDIDMCIQRINDLNVSLRQLEKFISSLQKSKRYLKTGNLLVDRHNACFEGEDVIPCLGDCNNCPFYSVGQDCQFKVVNINLFSFYQYFNGWNKEVALEKIMPQLGISIDEPLFIPSFEKLFYTRNLKGDIDLGLKESDSVRFLNENGKFLGDVILKNDTSSVEIPVTVWNGLWYKIPFPEPFPLWNLDKIYKARKDKKVKDIYVTDSLFIAKKVSRRHYNGLWTSFYGGLPAIQNLELDILKGFKVHYIITCHSGYSIEQAFEIALAFYKKIESYVDIDFYVCKKQEKYDDIKFELLNKKDFFRNTHVKKHDKNKYRYLLAPGIMEGDNIMLSGQKGTLKTGLGLLLATSVASGQINPFQLWRSKNRQRAVLYIDSEAGENIFNFYKETYEKSYNIDYDNIPLYFEHLDKKDFDAYSDAGLSTLKKAINSIQRKLFLVIVDHITLSASRESTRGWKKLFAYIKELNYKNITVILICHEVDGETVRKKTSYLKGSKDKFISMNTIISLGHTNKDTENKDTENKGSKFNFGKAQKKQITLKTTHCKRNPYPYWDTPLELEFDLGAEIPKWIYPDCTEYMTEALKALSKTKKIRQDDIALFFNVSQKTISKWLNKGYKNQEERTQKRSS